MITKNSTLVESALYKLLASENLLSALSDECWADSEDSPSDYLNLDSLETYRSVLERCQDQLKELYSAYECYEEPCMN